MKSCLSVIVACAVLAGAGHGSPALAREAETIIVTGVRLEEALADLEQCLAAGCPPLEDMQKTLRAAEIMVVDGNYRRASGLLEKSLGRNDRHAAIHGEAVAGLYRAHARVNQHMGEGDLYRRSTHRTLTSLRAALPDTDTRVLGGRLEVAGMLVRLGDVDLGLRAYRSLKQDAQKAGQPKLAAVADLRIAWTYLVWGKVYRARPLLETLTTHNDPDVRLAAKVMLTRLDRMLGKQPSMDALLSAVREQAAASTGPQVLHWSPPMDLSVRPKGPTAGLNVVGINADLVAAVSVENKWIDVGFWVTPEGHVQEAEVLRVSDKEGSPWHDIVLRSVSGRVYSPVQATPGSPGRYHVERFTLTSLWEDRTGSRLRSRSSSLRIESLDLTVDEGAEAGT